MEAEIITIGTELLLGEIVDTNSRSIARALREIGLDVYRTLTVGDNAERIAQAVRESMRRAQAVITTGGLGPTIDDATREGIARAVDVELEFRPDLWEQIEERFARFGRTPTENNRRQAFLPQGALAIENPIGSAPGFLYETETSVVIALPGVPAEMTHLLEHEVFPYLRRRLHLSSLLKTRILRTAGLGESALDARIQDLETLSNPTVGLAAHPGRVDVRITAKARTIHEAEEMIWKMEATVRQRLGDHIYGVDEETLEGATLEKTASHGLSLAVAECGTEGALASNLAPYEEPFMGGQILTSVEHAQELSSVLAQFQDERKAHVGLGLSLKRQDNLHLITIVLRLPDGEEILDRTYGGPPSYASQWAVSLALDHLRRRLS